MAIIIVVGLDAVGIGRVDVLATDHEIEGVIKPVSYCPAERSEML